MSDPNVSVIVPARDAADTLGEALDSILAQRRLPGEVIVVDDGSSDATAELAARRGGPVRCIRQAPAGAAAARNQGLRHASGGLVAFLDADDLWPPDSLALRVEALLAAPELDAVFGRVEEFVCARLGRGLRVRARARAPALLPGTLLARRALFERVGPFDPRWEVGEFVDFWARARERGVRARPVDAVVLRRRLHAGNQGVRKRALYARTYAAILAAHRRPPAEV